MPEVYLGLGSNLGDREENLCQAAGRLQPFCEIAAVSSLYESEAVGYREQQPFLNAVVAIGTDLEPHTLLRFLQETEISLKRVRSVPKGPRTIDLDILLYGQQIVEDEELVIPHPALHTRRFVLAPLCEVAPLKRHPLLHKTVAELLEELGGGQYIRRIKQPSWLP